MTIAFLLLAGAAMTVQFEDGRVFEVQSQQQQVEIGEPTPLEVAMASEQPRRPCHHHEMQDGSEEPRSMMLSEGLSLGSMLEGLVDQLLSMPTRLIDTADAHPCAREMAITGCSLPSCLKQYPEVIGGACAELLLSRSSAGPQYVQAPPQQLSGLPQQLAMMLGEPLVFERQQQQMQQMQQSDGNMHVMRISVFRHGGNDDEAHEHHHHHDHHEHWRGEREGPRLAARGDGAPELMSEEDASSCFSFLIALLFWSLVLRIMCRRCVALRGPAPSADAAHSLEPLEVAAIQTPKAKALPAYEDTLPSAVAVPVLAKPAKPYAKDPKDIDML